VFVAPFVEEREFMPLFSVQTNPIARCILSCASIDLAIGLLFGLWTILNGDCFCLA